MNLYTISFHASPANLRVATYAAALVAIAAARAVKTAALLNVFDSEQPGTVAVFCGDEPVAVVSKG